VTIVGILVRFLFYAIGDADRWNRLMLVVMPLLNLAVLVVLVLTAVTVWWLLADGGVQVLLHDFGPRT
jgi:hypothetical protein